ncbi:E4 34 kDa protein [California sea lion adenovirus 1]|uniref:E4 34 kDa protein n=1 Tax=California sea lion adenovirus 1 TaxID=943083 RepID=A0A059XDI2_9ADEN|nr:E4 34 kDa protein [California sea lion adenovirus 1]AIA22370.1 E4 34 kDa protein [California sea lion adenovirus 1]
MDDSSGVEHILDSVRSFSSAACFVGNREIPVLWLCVADEDTRRCLGVVERPCVCALQCVEEDKNYIYGNELFGIHCHCNSKFSLECISRAAVIKNLALKVISGTFVNFRFFWYGDIVSYEIPSVVGFVGCYFVDKIHYVVLKIPLSSDYSLVKANYASDSVVFVRSASSGYVIKVCTSCKDLSEENMKCCAEHSRSLLLSMLSCIKAFSAVNRPLYPCFKDTQRRKRIKRLMYYGTPIKRSKFMFGI